MTDADAYLERAQRNRHEAMASMASTDLDYSTRKALELARLYERAARRQQQDGLFGRAA